MRRFTLPILGFLLVFQILGSSAQALQCNHIESEDLTSALEQRACLMKSLRAQGAQASSSNLLAIVYRAFIQANSEVGYDLILNWDRYLEDDSPTATAKLFEALTEKADKAMLAKDFTTAFDVYSDIETRLRQLPERLRRANLHFRLYILHSMARALYGSGNYEKALVVYSWIPSVYPAYRQVLFEQMWTAFNIGRIDASLGAIASQRSSYFGRYLEPESYLVWIYILRKLCRNNEISMVRNLLKTYDADLRSGRYGVFEWAKSDPVAQSWANLVQANAKAEISGEARAERGRIESLLRARFNGEKKRLLGQLQKVDKFSYLALDAKTKAFPPTKEIRSYTGLLKIGFEMWPGGDAEDWWDEVGRHRFIGESRCQ